MWPQQLEAWISELRKEIEPRDPEADDPGFLGEDEWKVRNMLRQYPPLFDQRDPESPAWEDAGWIAHEAAARARTLARKFYGHPEQGVPGYIADVREFKLWLTNIGYRQALRLVLMPERVERELMLLPTEQKRLLYWRYLDRWEDDEIASALRFTLSPRQRLSPAEASALSTRAYRAFCARLRKAIPAGNRDVATFFPIFPGGVQ